MGRIDSLEMSSPHKYSPTLSTVERAVKILKYVVFNQQTVGTREAARILETSPSSAHRLFRTLAGLGLLKKDKATGKFGTGPELYRLAASLLASNDLRQAARGPMEALAERLGEAVYLCLRSGDNRIILDGVPGWRQFQYVVRLGETVPLYVSGSGHAIMAWLPGEEIERILEGELPRYTPRTVTDPEVLRRDLQEVRSQGFAITHGRHTEGGVGVSAPIFNVHNEVVGSVMLTIPETRVDEHGPRHELGRSVRGVADAISLRLGWKPED